MIAPPPDLAAFVRAQTSPRATILAPEIRLHLASAVTPLWQATEATLEATGLAPPYWAFAWPGGQALARYVLDRPETARGKIVLDFASGCGLAAIAAARAGAGRAVAVDIDALACCAARLNAALNEVVIETRSADPVGGDEAWDVVLAGDVCYERKMTERVWPWLCARATAGALVLLADPGRAYLPKTGLIELARYDVAVDIDVEDRPMRETIVYRVG